MDFEKNELIKLVKDKHLKLDFIRKMSFEYLIINIFLICMINFSHH